MNDQVFEVDAVRKRAVELLRREDRLMSLGQICVALALPHWAVSKGLESAYQAREVEFSPGAGWGRAQLDEARGDDATAMGGMFDGDS